MKATSVSRGKALCSAGLEGTGFSGGRFRAVEVLDVPDFLMGGYREISGGDLGHHGVVCAWFRVVLCGVLELMQNCVSWYFRFGVGLALWLTAEGIWHVFGCLSDIGFRGEDVSLWGCPCFGFGV